MLAQVVGQVARVDAQQVRGFLAHALRPALGSSSASHSRRLTAPLDIARAQRSGFDGITVYDNFAPPPREVMLASQLGGPSTA